MKSFVQLSSIALITLAGLFHADRHVQAQIVFDDGGVSTIDSLLTDYIVVRDSAMGMPTTVVIETGADIPNFDPDGQDTSIQVEGSSIVEINDGVTAGGFNLLDDSTGIFLGGVVGDELQAFGNAVVTIGTSAGTAAVLDIQDDLELANNSVCDMYEGRVFDDVETTGSAVLNLYGGEYDEDVEAFDTSVINIFGGTYSTGFGDLDDIEGGEIAAENFEDDNGNVTINAAVVNIHGGTFVGALFDPDFCVEGDGTINIYGTDFAVDGSPVPFGPISATTGFLTGVLEDKSELNNDFEQADNGMIVLVEAADVLLGDINCDGEVNLLDVTPFVDLVTNGGFSDKADLNQDGVVDLLDVAPFVALLTGG